jgi:hypothetical protein
VARLILEVFDLKCLSLRRQRFAVPGQQHVTCVNIRDTAVDTAELQLTSRVMLQVWSGGVSLIVRLMMMMMMIIIIIIINIVLCVSHKVTFGRP